VGVYSFGSSSQACMATREGGGSKCRHRHREAGFRYTPRGYRHNMALGSLNTIDLLKTYAKARTCRQLVLAGKDPLRWVVGRFATCYSPA
jgi:hypothetical protein